MVLTKGHRVWRQLKPRSALLEWKDVTDGALLFESDNVAALCEFFFVKHPDFMTGSLSCPLFLQPLGRLTLFAQSTPKACKRTHFLGS